jgi:uncharacterized protein YdaU (DUF1376 family)
MSGTSNSTKLWMPLYVADYLADTSRLTTEQHGAYLLLMFDYWRNGALPDDDAVLAQVCRLSLDAWSIHRAVLRGFFSPAEDGLLHQKRIDAEITKAQLNRSVSVSRAKKAAEARWGKDTRSNAPSSSPALLDECPSPSPTPLKTNTTETPEGFSLSPAKTAKAKKPSGKHAAAEIDRVYQAYPLKKAPGAARVAIGKAVDRLIARGESDPIGFLVARIGEWKAVRDRDGAAGRFVANCPYPATFFNQECYDEESLQPAKNCALPSGELVTAAELKDKTGWEVMGSVA